MYKQVLQDFKTKDLRRLIEDKTSCIKLHQTKYNLILYPYHFNNVKQSVKDLLNVVITKYDKKLGGILIGYKNIKILEPDGGIQADSCFIHIDIEGDFYVFLPKVGKKLSGIVNKISDDHVGCLVHKVFNVSIPNVDADENWLGKQVELGQEVLLRVTFLNLEGPLPYIRTKLLSLGAKPDPASVNYLNIPEHNFESSIKQNKHVKYNKQLIDDEETDFNHPETNEIQTKHKKKSKKHSVEYTEETSSSKLQEEEAISSTKKKKNSKKLSIENFEDTPAESIKEEKFRKSLEYLTQLQSSKTQEDSISKKKKKSTKDLEDSSGGVTPKKKKSQTASESLDEYPTIAELISKQKKSLNYFEDLEENSDSLRLSTAPKEKKAKYTEESINIAKVQKKKSKKNTSDTFENDSATNDLSSNRKKSKKSFDLDSQKELNHFEADSSVTPKKKKSLENPKENFDSSKIQTDLISKSVENFEDKSLAKLTMNENPENSSGMFRMCGRYYEALRGNEDYRDRLTDPESSALGWYEKKLQKKLVDSVIQQRMNITYKKNKLLKSIENKEKSLENNHDIPPITPKKKKSKKSLENNEDTLDISEIQTSLISNAFENFKDKSSTVEEKSKKKKLKKSLENQEDNSTATKINQGRNISAQTPPKQLTPKKKLKNISFDSKKTECENGPQTPDEKKLTNDLSLYFSKIGESTPYLTKKTDQHFDTSLNISKIHSLDSSSPKKRKRDEDELDDTSTNKKKKHKHNKQEETSSGKSELDLIKESLLAQKLADLKAESSEYTKKPYLSVMPVKNLQAGTIKKRRHTTQERLVSVNSNVNLNLHDSDLDEILNSNKPEENAPETNKDVKKMKKKRRLSMLELPVETVDSQVEFRHKKKKKSVTSLDD